MLVMVFTASEAPTDTPTPAAPPIPREKFKTPALAIIRVLSSAASDTEPTAVGMPISLSMI